MSLNPKYPNLELIEYKAKLALSKDAIFDQRIKDKKEKLKHIYHEFEIEVFRRCGGLHVQELILTNLIIQSLQGVQ